LLSYLPTTNCAKPWLRIEPDTSRADTGLTDGRRAAVFLEPIQGEGEIVVPEIMTVAKSLGDLAAARSTG
jgi:acetylornithine/succinyldiaminopimelate/putrescine aminotransferase